MNPFVNDIINILAPEAANLGFTMFSPTCYGSEAWKSDNYPILAVEAAESGLALFNVLEGDESIGSSFKADEIADTAHLFIFFEKRDGTAWDAVRNAVMDATDQVLNLLGRALDFANGDARYTFTTQPGTDSIANVQSYVMKIAVRRETNRFRNWVDRAGEK